MSWEKHHGRAKSAHKVLGALGAGDKAHAQREPGDPRHAVHHAHQGLGHGLKAVEGVVTWGEKVIWTGIKWGVFSAGLIGAATYATHNVDALKPAEGYFDLGHDALYAGGAAVWDVAMMTRRGWREAKAIGRDVYQALDHSETAVRSAGRMPGRLRRS